MCYSVELKTWWLCAGGMIMNNVYVEMSVVLQLVSLNLQLGFVGVLLVIRWLDQWQTSRRGITREDDEMVI